MENGYAVCDEAFLVSSSFFRFTNPYSVSATKRKMVMLYVMKHSLSRQAFSDILILIQCLLPKRNFTTSVYKINDVLKKAMSFKEPKPCYYCNHCQIALKQDHLCQKNACRRKK